MPIPRWLKIGLGAAALGAVGYAAYEEHKGTPEVGGGADEPDDVEAPADTPLPNVLRYPVPSEVVTSPFGSRKDPTGGTETNHNGVDFRAPEGTPLQAPGAGTVTRVWSDDLNGNALKIKVGDKTFGFAHMQSIAVKSGDTFDTGDVLGKTGGGGPHEGHSTGPHLHMTMRDSTGQTVDPMSVTWASQVA